MSEQNEFKPDYDVILGVLADLQVENAGLKQQLAEAQASNERLRDALNNITQDYHAEVQAKYTDEDLKYPSMQRSKDSDMTYINEAEALLRETPKQSLANSSNLVFRTKLENLIQTAFNNEQKFIERFLHKKITDVNAIYMAASGVKVYMSNEYMERFSTVIDTDKFIGWCDQM